MKGGAKANADSQAEEQHWLQSSTLYQVGSVSPEGRRPPAEGQNLLLALSPEATQAAFEGQQHEWQAPADQAASKEAPLTDPPSAVWPATQRLERSGSSRLHLAPMEIPDDHVLHNIGPKQAMVQDTPPPDTYTDSVVPDGLPLNSNQLRSQSSIPAIPLEGHKPHHQSVLQGAVARNQAAVAAHRARLHLKIDSPADTAGSAQHADAAGRHGWAVPLKKYTTPVTPRGLASQRSSLDTGRPACPLSRLSSVTSSTELHNSFASGLGSPSHRPPPRRFGSAAFSSSLDTNHMAFLQSAAQTDAGHLSPEPWPPQPPLRHGRSVATTVNEGYAVRHSLDMGQPLSPGLGGRATSPLIRGASVTIAQIMKQNSRLPPLEHAPLPSPRPKALLPLRYDSVTPLLPCRYDCSICSTCVARHNVRWLDATRLSRRDCLCVLIRAL